MASLRPDMSLMRVIPADDRGEMDLGAGYHLNGSRVSPDFMPNLIDLITL